MNSSITSNYYLDRFKFSEQEIFTSPEGDLNLVIVIPSFKEPLLIDSLESLLACETPNKATEVIIMINCSEMLAETRGVSEEAFAVAIDWAEKNSQKNLQFHVIKNLYLPKKHAGVGLARKIGMDEAVRRLELANNPQGVIVCFDADSKVDSNYLVEIEKHFDENPKTPACSIHYEHPLNGVLNDGNYVGIVNYEMHLRYYIHALKYAGYINAYQTIGSSMAVRSFVYQKQGGMNRRKAGEDFYFLHKIIPLGGFSEITSTKVFPSPRYSDRVPFGTGKAVGDFMKCANQIDYPSFSFNCFEDLKAFLLDVESFYGGVSVNLEKYPLAISEYMCSLDFQSKMMEIRRQSSTIETFVNRFYRWFDGLKVLQYVHFARDNFHANTDIKEAVLAWNQKTGFLNITDETTKKDILLKQRIFDRGGS